MRLRFAMLAAFVAALLLTVAGAAAGSIGTPPGPSAASDPMTTNVPYLAWAGEQVKLVAGTDEIRRFGRDHYKLEAKFSIEAWTGDPFGGPVFTTDPTSVGCGDHNWVIDIASTRPGLAIVKFTAWDKEGNLAIDHQFLVGWMTLNDPALTELPFGGDAIGTGSYVAGADPGLVRVMVTGTLPLNNMIPALGVSLTLPSGWEALAGAMATTDDGTGKDPMRWDIHDDMLATEGHVSAADCQIAPFSAVDAVDTCYTAKSPSGPFSTFFGSTDPDHPVIGPFDPVFPFWGTTLLSNGRLDWGDAPMPAARVDVAITPNTGGATDISGAGSLADAWKSEYYVRATGHTFYAPFYAAFIPATARSWDDGSGIDAARDAQNFPGFLNEENPYVFWDGLQAVNWDNGATTCKTTVTPLVYRNEPAGVSAVSVYTDEHGEAQVAFEPGTGFFFDNLPVIKNLNGGCDLQGIDVLGTASITAVARYPYQPVTMPDRPAPTTLVKTIHSDFDKSLTAVPKGPGSDNAVAQIVTASARDIDGTPFADEVVCFSADHNAESMVLKAGYAKVTDPSGIGRLCTTTDSAGKAAVEVMNSNGGRVDVIAHFVDEQLLRHIFVNFGEGAAAPSVPSTSVPTQQQVVAVVGAANAAAVTGQAAPATKTGVKAKKATAKVAYARLVKGQLGRYIVVRVNGTATKAALKIKLVNGKGKVLLTTTRTVKTNKQVPIKNLKVAKTVTSVRAVLSA